MWLICLEDGMVQNHKSLQQLYQKELGTQRGGSWLLRRWDQEAADLTLGPEPL